MKSQKGFTLIELLVVISILGILAAVAVPNVAKFIGRGNLEAANMELSTVETAVAAYMVDNSGAAPTGTGNLTSYLSKPLKGTYTIAADGSVTGVTYPNLTWDAATKSWIE